MILRMLEEVKLHSAMASSWSSEPPNRSEIALEKISATSPDLLSLVGDGACVLLVGGEATCGRDLGNGIMDTSMAMMDLHMYRNSAMCFQPSAVIFGLFLRTSFLTAHEALGLWRPGDLRV